MSSIKYGLVDCNNFFVSCERVFNPKLLRKPVVVLSNNDGCVIARSKEAKELQIPMGAPAFHYRQTFLRHDVAVLSSNFALYGDMSNRVMETLETFGFPIEVYSIDEAFLEVPSDMNETVAAAMRSKILQWTGIPISLGVGATKTLAKMGSELAKKRDDGLFFVEQLIEAIPVQDVWGIGAQITAELNRFGIYTAGQLARQSNTWIAKHFTNSLLRVVLELRGTSCMTVEESAPPKKGITSSRSFGRLIESSEEIKEAVASLTAIAAEKLRREQLQTAYLTVFVVDKDRHYRAQSSTLSIPTSYTPHLITQAHRLLASILQEKPYRKAGVMLNNLTPEEEHQLDLFDHSPKKNLMPLIDKINQKRHRRSLFFAAEGTSGSWKSVRRSCSPHFTTQWSELLVINL